MAISMPNYRVRIIVKEVRGCCAVGYNPGDEFIVERFYVVCRHNTRICLHALIAMSTLLSAFLKGFSAREIGIGEEDDIGYLQCPDPGKPYTAGGTIIFELRREKIP